MSPERKAEIEAWSEIAEDFSDGAYMGFMMVEHDVTVDELVEVFGVTEPSGSTATEGGDDA